MTVSSEINRKDYAGNGSTTEFATEFRFLVDTSIKVIVTDTAGVETDQTLTTDYTVTGVGDDSGGTVTMIVPPASGETLTIKRDGPITQLTDYVENDDFPAESHERALDKLTMLQQQQQEEIDRSLKLSEGQTSTGLTIPAPDTGKFLQWDASGNFINVDIADQGLLVVTPFGETLVAAADAAAGRVIMESAKKVSSAVTDNITTFDADDEAKDSGINIARVVQIADAAGTADVITAAFTPAIGALTKGLEVRVRALLANATTTPTINYNGLGAKTIVKKGNQPLAIGDIANPDHELQLVYNLGNDTVELLNPAAVEETGLTVNVLAKVIFSVSGTVVTIHSSDNVTSLTRNSTGLYTLVPIEDFPDALYGTLGFSEKLSAIGGSRLIVHDTDMTKTTTAFQFSNESTAGARVEAQYSTVYLVG